MPVRIPGGDGRDLRPQRPRLADALERLAGAALAGLSPAAARWARAQVLCWALEAYSRA